MVDHPLSRCFRRSALSATDTTDRRDGPRSPGPELLVFESADNWPPDSIRRLVEGDWIRRNWENEAAHADYSPVRKDFCDQIAESAGVLLEVAAGPGGGNLAPVLRRNPHKSIVANDLSADVLRLWQSFLRQKALGDNVVLAAFDAKSDVIEDGVLSQVSSMGGISSTDAADEVLKQCRRALVPGGMLFCCHNVVDPSDWERLPQETRTRWEKRSPGLVHGYADMIGASGFTVDLCRREPGRKLDKDEGDLPRDASRFGIELHVAREWIRARKTP